MSDFMSSIQKFFSTKELDSGRFSTFRIGPMKNTAKHYEVEGFGHVSYMESTALFGLMKMETLIATPILVDAPLFNIDTITVGGKKTVIVEFYDTFLQKDSYDETSLLEMQKDIEGLPDYKSEPRWYTPIRLPSSWAKKVNKKDSEAVDKAAILSLERYLEKAASMPKLVKGEITIKKELDAAFAARLVEEGGVSTDMFVKKLGKEETLAFFHDVFYGV